MRIKEYEVSANHESDLARKIVFEILGLQAVHLNTMNRIREAIEAEQATLTH